MEIAISPEELANDEMSQTHLDQAVSAIRTRRICYPIRHHIARPSGSASRKDGGGFTHIDDSVCPPN